MKEDECTCDIFDIGPRCGYCVRKCSEQGHPCTESKVNGQNHYCGLPIAGVS